MTKNIGILTKRGFPALSDRSKPIYSAVAAHLFSYQSEAETIFDSKKQQGYAIAEFVPGSPGMVISPYGGMMIDATNISHGTLVAWKPTAQPPINRYSTPDSFRNLKKSLKSSGSCILAIHHGSHELNGGNPFPMRLRTPAGHILGSLLLQRSG